MEHLSDEEIRLLRYIYWNSAHEDRFVSLDPEWVAEELGCALAALERVAIGLEKKGMVHLGRHDLPPYVGLVDIRVFYPSSITGMGITSTGLAWLTSRQSCDN